MYVYIYMYSQTSLGYLQKLIKVISVDELGNKEDFCFIYFFSIFF